ncbi:MAG: DUF354 domain-containing protein [Pyrinomonadaceae bacterium]
MDNTVKSIWIDVDNSPHVPLFAPIIHHYRKKGIEVILTARDHSQTIELLSLAGHGDSATVIGRHYGKSKINKVRGLLDRAGQLVAFIKKDRKPIAVALSHGSRSMVLAARWLKIPVITMYDYEFTETAIFNRFSTRVLVPGQISNGVLEEIGLSRAKLYKYPGIKEELYIRSFQPKEGFLAGLCNRLVITDVDEKVLTVLRPPATTANYHARESEGLLFSILQRLTSDQNVFTIIAPRTREQAAEIGEFLTHADVDKGSFHILESAINGLDLAFASDLLISGGGTMNREAALLGVPVYSIFAGRQGALDKQMEADGLITFIRHQKDIGKIALKKREREAGDAFSNRLTDRVERFVIEQINAFL